MIIDQLPSVGTPSLTDETVTEQGQNLFKVTWQRLLALFKGNTMLSELSNDAGFVDASGAAAAAPVQSVNEQTGAVTVPTPTYNQTNITSGTHDLNDYTTPGLYYFSSGATLTNSPNGAVNGWIWVLAPNTGGVRKQIWVRHGSNPNTTKDFYMRLLSSGTWGDWFGWMNQWELLWENASPYSQFPAQTISLDTSYDYYMIVCLNTLESNAAGYSCHIVPALSVDIARSAVLDTLAFDFNMLHRQYRIVPGTGMAFSEGHFGVGTSSGNNYYLNPVKIFGIKGVG